MESRREQIIKAWTDQLSLLKMQRQVLESDLVVVKTRLVHVDTEVERINRLIDTAGRSMVPLDIREEISD